LALLALERELLLMLQNSDFNSSISIEQDLQKVVRKDQSSERPSSTQHRKPLRKDIEPSKVESQKNESFKEFNSPPSSPQAKTIRDEGTDSTKRALYTKANNGEEIDDQLQNLSQSNIDGIMSLIEILSFRQRVTLYADQILEDPVGSTTSNTSGARWTDAQSSYEERVRDGQFQLEQMNREADMRRINRRRDAELEADIKQKEATALLQEKKSQVDLDAEIKHRELERTLQYRVHRSRQVHLL
jgi:hypothetical protein